MRSIRNKWIVMGSALACFGLAVLSLVLTFWESPETKELQRVQEIHEIRGLLSQQLGPKLLHNEWQSPLELDWFGDSKKVDVTYTIDPELQAEAEKLLRIHKPDYGAIVVMDAVTGRVKALASINRREENSANLAFRGTFPAASIFKIVTAGAAVDKHGLGPNSIVMFNGSNHTLYRKNVMSNNKNRWTREMTLREAFARSVNTFFGRLTFEKLSPSDIQEYAIRFGFNKHIQSDLPFDPGFTNIPHEESFELAEIVSGYNRVTTMSPIQGAMIAAAVAEDGVMKVPYIVDQIRDEDGKIIFQAEPVTAAVALSPEGADRLKVLMEATITSGTSRRSFKPLMRDRRFKELEVGGKTGSLTGTNPRGKTDWFVGYAIGEKDKLAVAAITVNVDYWTVKSSHLAQSMFKKHFKEEYVETARRMSESSEGSN
ncbi:MAG: penicillin-binding transpeptidase domain-containing protein [Pseudobdellovibrionaceae bacterium]